MDILEVHNYMCWIQILHDDLWYQHFFLRFLYLLLFLFLKAEEAARESRQMKQDHYAEMRRKKDEEREAQERLLVGHGWFAYNTV